MTKHIVEAFEAELERLRKSIAEMGALAGQQLRSALEAVRDGDESLAMRVVERDREIDEMERRMAHDAVTLLALRQPMASDLRALIAVIKIPADLERIGDLAKGIAKRAPLFRGGAPRSALRRLTSMCELVLDQLEHVVAAYTSQDADAAARVWRQDNEVDDWHSSLFRELLTYMMEDARTIGTCTHLLFMAKNVERMGDHCTNIAETTYYMITGSPLPESRPKGADVSTIVLEANAR